MLVCRIYETFACHNSQLSYQGMVLARMLAKSLKVSDKDDFAKSGWDFTIV